MRELNGGKRQASSWCEPGWLRLVMDSVHEGFGLLAPDFTIIELNKEAARVNGRAREGLIGQSLWLACPQIERDEVGELIKKAMAERISISLEHRHEQRNGATWWFETSAFPIENGCLAILFRNITDRRLTGVHCSERAIHAATEQRFKAAVAAFEGVLWTNSAEGEMVGEQSGWAELTGQTLSQYQGFGWATAIHPDDAPSTLQAWRAAVNSRSTFKHEHRVRRHDGEWRLCAVRAVPILDAYQAVVEWVGIHRDITDTRADMLRLQQIAETIDAVFYVREIDQQRITFVSRAYEEIWGRSCDELYADARSFLKSVHPDDRATLRRALRNQVSGTCVPLEYRLRFKDGTERVILDRPRAAIDPVNGAIRVVGLASDITEFRKAQKLLARNAETFANLVAANPFGIYVVDADFKLVQMSQGAAAVFAGVHPLIGRDLAEVLRIIWTEPFASEVIGSFRHTLSTGQPFVSHSTVERRANIDEVEAYDWRIERVTLADGQPGVVCYFYDLSERNASEAKLTQALTDKELLVREIDHRVKNSLAVVGSLLSMQCGASASDETRAALDEAATRVIAVARIHERLHKSNLVGVVAFGEYLEQLCGDLESSMRRPHVKMDCRAISINLRAENAMPLALIANELITNAFKHGCAAGATKISVILDSDGQFLNLTVIDNGAGISARSMVSSTSLGLKVVSALARQLDAKTYLPASGLAAKFVISIPMPHH